MKTMKLSLYTLSALAFFLIPAQVMAGSLHFRGRVGVIRPHVRLSVDVGRDHFHHRITGQDRRIAKRLAWYSGISRHRLLKYRAKGHRWAEIGRWLDLPRHVVRAARRAETWRAFVRLGGY